MKTSDIDFHDTLEWLTSELNKIYILDPIPSQMREYSSLSATLAKDASNLAGVLAALPSKKKEEIENTLTS
jgi:hypothetical protein